MPGRALLLSAYIKFVNLFPEVKATIQDVLRSDSQLRNADVELQQRAVEYLRLSTVASTDILVGARARPRPPGARPSLPLARRPCRPRPRAPALLWSDPVGSAPAPLPAPPLRLDPAPSPAPLCLSSVVRPS